MSAPTEVIRVLHVDDEPDFSDMVATYLEREDDRMTVRTATSAEEGLATVAETDVDCIVSDYEMAGKNGLEFLEAVRTEYPDLPFILYTGKGSEEIASEAITAGVTDYLQKGTDSSQYTVLANRIANVVDQHRSRQAIAETEQKLSQLAEHTEDILFMFDGDWSELLFINSAYEDIWGGSIEELHEDPKSFLEYIHPADLEKAIESIGHLVGGDAVDIEYRVRGPDGEQRWINGKTKPILDEQRDVSRIVGYVRDITDRKQREQDLEEANSVLSTLFETLPVGVAVLNSDGRIERANERAETVLGLTESGVSDRTYDDPDWEIFDDDGDPIPAENLPFARVLETGEPVYKFEHGITLPGGDERWLTINAVPIRDDTDEIERVVTTIADITDSREQDRVIESHIARLEQLQRKTQRLMQTPTKEETARVAVETAQEVLGATLSGVHLVSDDGQALEPIAFIDTVRDEFGDPPVYHRDADADTPAGAVWEAYNSLEPRLIDDTHEVGTLAEMTPARSAIIHPIDDHGVFIVSSTEPHAFDDTDQTLVDLVSLSLTSALDRVEREQTLREQKVKLDEFAGVVSHDLRNPLSVAEGRLDLAREDCDSEHLDAIEKAVHRMNRITEDVLWLAREGRDIASVDPVVLHDAIDEAWDIVADGTEHAELRFAGDDLSTVTIKADDDRLCQLLENLFSNAIDHGGEDVIVTVGAVDAGFYVEDDGPGIPEDRREEVFTAGYSLRHEGTGFGLSIVKRVVDAHGWEIRVTESAEGGARFEITGVEVVGE